MNNQEFGKNIILSGLNGYAGSEGTNGQSWTEQADSGKDARCSWGGENSLATPGTNGKAGDNGIDGTDGGDGTSVSLTLSVANLFGDLSISVLSGDGGSGGNGGKGGCGQAGGNGGRGAKCRNEEIPGAVGGNGGDGGKGGDGGNGGNGGDGGIVTILYGDKNGDLKVDLSPGTGGASGRGATGGAGGSAGIDSNPTGEKSTPGQNGANGTNGKPGNPGKQGQIKIFKQPTSPILKKLEPLTGPSAGGTEFVLTGENLVNGTLIKFNTSLATDIRYISENEIHGKTPEKSDTDNADVYIVAIDPAGSIGVLNQTFKYTN